MPLRSTCLCVLLWLILYCIPDLRDCVAFHRLSGRITAQQMRRMNYAVDGEKKHASEGVREFLRTMSKNDS